MISVRLVDEARQELEAAARHYEDQRSGLGEEFLEEIRSASRRIQEFPHAWQWVSARCRRCRLHRVPYGLVYRVREGEALILAIMHMSRRPGYWSRRDKP